MVNRLIRTDQVLFCRSMLYGVGTAGVMGGIWNVPQLAASQIATCPFELLDFDTISGLTALLTKGSMACRALAAACECQLSRTLCTATAVEHNQVCSHMCARKVYACAPEHSVHHWGNFQRMQ